jgi:hypothetical protein
MKEGLAQKLGEGGKRGKYVVERTDRPRKNLAGSVVTSISMVDNPESTGIGTCTVVYWYWY